LELFESIGLKADPFTTSPNPDLFFPAKEHKQCLEGLELAIRMRRGLSVVRGGIGTGKTTISRKLIQNFASEEDMKFDFYPVLDPKFESELVLLQHLVDLFGIEEEAGSSVIDCRNQIEHHLINAGVEEGRVLVLVIDEGQNLKGEFLDVFRTLLNFETDDFKLLQLVIFGQPEMTSIIHEYPNFEDRITFNFELGPLDYESVEGIIRHRLAEKGGDREYFTEEAIRAIHHQTQGYPRKINKLCHQLLLNMMSENEEVVSLAIVENTIGGKVPDGLIDKEEPEEEIVEKEKQEEEQEEKKDVAVNKLFDILRKGGKKEGSSGKIGEAVSEDDIIGDLYGDEEDDEEDELEEEIIDEEKESKWYQRRKQRLKRSVGSYPANVSTPPLKKEKLLLGMAMDQGHIYTTLIQDKSGVKSIVGADIFPATKAKLDPKRNPTGFSVAIGKAYDQLTTKLEKKGSKVARGIIKKLHSGVPISFTINNTSSLLKTVMVPLENKKERKMIIEYDAKKNLPFNSDDIIFDAIELEQGKNIIGVANAEYMESPAKTLSEKNWDVRLWYPSSQAVLNAFRWNYPGKKHDIILIIHIGEIESFLLGYNQGSPDAIVPLDLGIQNLTDAWKYRSTSAKAKWNKRDYCRVPPSILKTDMKDNSTNKQKKPQDDAMRPVIEGWDQELERALNSMAQSFPVDNISEIFLSGCAEEILFLDEYLQTQLDVNVEYLNPLKNIAFYADEEESFELSKPALTTALGAALNLDRSVNLLPDMFKESEKFRVGNKFGIPAAAAIFAGVIALTGWTSVNHEQMETKLSSMKSQASSIAPIKNKFEKVSSDKNIITKQLDILQKESKLSNLSISVMRFFSYNTPKEITLDLISFQRGWERGDWIHVGNSLEKVITIIDEDKEFAKVTGAIVANPALKERYFSNFITQVENSGLFKKIDVINKKTTSGMDIDNMTFELKCEL
jgi:type II secretory pathway predicted ATPase ExeA/Tfp pilus assembly PilM family ATPase